MAAEQSSSTDDAIAADQDLDFGDTVSSLGGSKGLNWTIPLLPDISTSVSPTGSIAFGPLVLNAGLDVAFSFGAALDIAIDGGGDATIGYDIDPNLQASLSSDGSKLTIGTAGYSVTGGGIDASGFDASDTTLDVGLNLTGSASVAAQASLNVANLYTHNVLNDTLFDTSVAATIPLLHADASDVGSDGDEFDLADYASITANLPTTFTPDASYTAPSTTGQALPSVSTQLVSNPIVDASLDLTELATIEFPPIGEILHGEGDLFNYDFPGLSVSDVLGPAGEVIDAIIDGLGDVYDAAGDLIGEVAGEAGNLANQAGAVAGDIYTSAGELIGNATNEVETAIDQATGQIYYAVKDAVGTVEQVGGQIAQAVWNGFAWATPSNLASIIPNFVESLPSIIPAAANILADTPLLNQIYPGLSAGTATFLDGAGQLVNEAGQLLDSAGNVIGDIWSGITGALGGIHLFSLAENSTVGANLANSLGQILSPQNINVSYEYSTLDASVDEALDLVQKLTFTPKEIDVTMTTSTGETQTGVLGDSFTFDAPTGDEPFSITTSYTLVGTLTSEFGIESDASLDFTELEAKLAGITILPGDVQKVDLNKTIIWLSALESSSEVDLQLPPGSTDLGAYGVPTGADGAMQYVSLTNEVAPSIAAITVSGPGIDAGGNGAVTTGATLTLAVAFSETVDIDTAAGSPTLNLSNGGVALYAGLSGSDTLLFTYQVKSGQDTTDLAIASLDLSGATLADSVGNAADVAAATGYNPAGTLLIETVAPNVTVGLADDTGTLGNDGITTDPALTGNADPGATVVLSIDGTTVSKTIKADSNGVWTYDPVGIADGQHSVTASETDAAGLTGKATFAFTLNRVAPRVLSIATDPAASVSGDFVYLVTFSEPVSGVNASDFGFPSQDAGSPAVKTVTPVAGSGGTQYRVEVVTSAAVVGLDLTGRSITDLAGNDFIQALTSQGEFDVGTAAVAIAAADVNGDGKPDLIVADAETQTVSVMLGNGDGTFAPATATYATGQGLGFDPTQSERLAVGDFNGDHHQDLVTANVSTNTVSVLFGNGDGTFQAAQTEVVGADPDAVATGDLNGDGDGDIVVANYQAGTVSVLLANDDGTFRPQQVFAVGLHPDYVAIGDLNGDGHPDLVVANAGSDTVSVLLGNGDGTFQAAETYAVGTLPVAVAIGDLNGDGRPDIVVANNQSDTVSVLINQGNGTFALGSTLAVPNDSTEYDLQPAYQPTGIAIADLNGDGKPDIITSNADLGPTIFTGNGDGTFAPGVTANTDGYDRSMVVTDLNGDGKPDVLDLSTFGNTASVDPLLSAPATVLGPSFIDETGTVSLVHDTSITQHVTSDPAITARDYVFDPDSTISFTIDGTPIAATVTSDDEGGWTFDPTGLADGSHTIVASDTGASGNTRIADISFVLKTTAPKVTIGLKDDTGSSSVDDVTSDPALTGTGDPNSSVYLTATLGTGGGFTALAKTDANGVWSYTPSALFDGTYTATVSQVDEAGNVATSSLRFELLEQGPELNYSLSDLPVPAGSVLSSAIAISNSGEIVGEYKDSQDDYHAFTDIDGTVTALPNGTIDANGVNDEGEIIGAFEGGTGGFSYDGKTVTALLDPTGTLPLQPQAINDAGTIVGYFDDDNGVQHGFVQAGSTFTVLDDPAGQPGTTAASGINDAGQIIGTSQNADGNDQGFLYQNGVYTPIVDPIAGETETRAIAINSAGEVAGSAFDGKNNEYGFVYRDGTYTTIGANSPDPQALNDDGTIVGLTTQNFQFPGGTFLNVAFPETAIDPFRINDAGQVVGYMEPYGADEPSAFVASPVVTASTSTGATTVAAGSLVTTAVSFSETVDVTGLPALTLNNGAEAVYLGGSGGNTLTFSYLPKTGDDTGDLTVTGFDPSEGSIENLAGVPFTTAMPTIGLGLRVDTTAPGAPTIDAVTGTGPANGTPPSNGGSTDDTQLTIELDLAGTGAEAGDTVQLSSGSTTLGPSTTISAAEVASGKLDRTVSNLADGTYALSATITDAVGNTSAAAAAYDVTVDTVAPKVEITSAGGLVHQAQQTIFGTVDPADQGTTVTVLEGDEALGSGVVSSTGTWQAAVTLTGSGTHTLQAEDTDAAGNTGTSGTIGLILYPAGSEPVDDPLAVAPYGTIVTGINNAGDMVGYYNTSAYGGAVQGFLFNGATFASDASPSGAMPLAIDDAGDEVGAGFSKIGVRYAPLVDPNATSGTTGTGINNEGEIVGTYYATGSGTHGFADEDGSFQTIDDPNATKSLGTWVTGVNDSGQVVGYYLDSNDLPHSFVEANGVFTPVEAPFASYTVASGIDDLGQVVGFYDDVTGRHSFIDDGGVFTPLDDVLPPDLTEATGVDDSGDIVGLYNDGRDTHGFLLSDAPLREISVTAISPNTGVSSLDGYTSEPVVAVSGKTISSDAGDKVSVDEDGVLVGVTTADDKGGWSLSGVTLTSAGEHTLTATVSDGAGHTATSAAATVVLETTPAPAIENPSGPTSGNDLTILGFADPLDVGTFVTILDGQNEVGGGTVNSDGSWSAPVNLDGLGDHSLRAEETDYAGLTGYSSPVTFDVQPQVACYVQGTRILTAAGEVAIEALASGDLLVTAAGAHRPVRWIGHRHLTAVRHSRPEAVWPVRVRAGAFGLGLPARDLWISPGHNVLVGGVLMPVRVLVNGATVTQEPVDTVTYWHVELDTHDVILAEGLPAESFLDTGNRAAFANGGTFVEVEPDFEGRAETETCAPVVKTGPAVEAAKTALLDRAAAIGHQMTDLHDLHVIADRRRFEPIALGNRRFAFALPAGCKAVALVSRTFVPAHVKPASTDTRMLGVAVHRLQVDGDDVDLREPLGQGWHGPEQRPGHLRRWTQGAAALPPGGRLVILDLAGYGRYWAGCEDDAVAMRA